MSLRPPGRLNNDVLQSPSCNANMLTLVKVVVCPAAEDARESAAEAGSDLKHGAKKASIKASSAAEEGKEKTRGWFSRIFRRGKVGSLLLLSCCILSSLLFI